MATEKCVPISGSSYEIIGFVDERGVPFLTSENHGLPKNTNSISEVQVNYSDFVVDLLTGNMLEYDPFTKTKTINEAAFVPRMLILAYYSLIMLSF